MQKLAANCGKVALGLILICGLIVLSSLWQYRAFGITRMRDLTDGQFVDQWHVLGIPVFKQHVRSGFESYFSDIEANTADHSMIVLYSRSAIQPPRGGNTKLVYFAIGLRDCGALQDVDGRKRLKRLILNGDAVGLRLWLDDAYERDPSK